MDLTVRAYPKINIGLYVGKKREDGFHPIVSIFQKVYDFYDEIIIGLEFSEKKDIEVSGLEGLVAADGNTLYRAAVNFLDLSGIAAKAKIHMSHHGIPLRSGLGGPSSDAASVILAMNRLCNNAVGRDTLFEVACKTGSDVPFFVSGYEASLVRGRGEILNRIESRRDVGFSLIPSGYVKKGTGEAYAILDSRSRIPVLPDGDELVSMYNSDVEKWNFRNDFELIYPALPESFHLSGAGTWGFELT